MRAYVRYAYAIAAVPLAILLRFALQPLIGSGTPYVALFPVTVAVALIAGMGPAIVTGVLGSIATDYFFIEPLYAIDLDVIGLSRMAVVTLTSAFVGYFGDVLRAARAKAEEQAQALRGARDELEGRVQERTRELIAEVAERRRSEQAVEAERKRFFDVLETVPVYVVLLTEDYHVPFANRFFRERFGESNGKRCYEYLFGLREPCEIRGTYTVLKTNQPHHWEWTGPDGHNYDIFDFPFTDTDGSHLIMEMGIDITEQRHAEESLRSASLYARGLLEASLDPLVTISPEGKITDVNKATELATGVPRDQLIASDFSSYFTEPEKASVGYRKVISEGLVRDYLLTIRHASGSTMDVLYNATVYRNEAGQIEGVFAAARDITERNAAAKRQGVIHSLLEPLAAKSSRNEYLDVAAEVIRDWSGCEFTGIRVRDNEENIPYESYVGFDEDFLAMENALNLGCDHCVCIRAILESPQKDERTFMTARGSFYCNDSLAFWNALSDQRREDYRGYCITRGFRSIAVVPIRYRDEVMGAIHIADFHKDLVPLSKIEFIETTVAPLIGEALHRFNAEMELGKYRAHLEELVERRTGELEDANRQLQSEMAQRQQIADDLARSNKDLEQFADVASHDLQEPLRAVSGFVGLLRLQLQGSLDARKAEYMNFAVDGVARMQTLINGLLEYSRIGTGGRASEATDAKAALDRALLDLQASIEESGAKITAGPLPTVHIDPVQMAQLLQNLIGNAIKFRSKWSPEIHISATRQPKAWQFAVTDNGIGIEPQYAERIFLIFQRLHTRREYPGTGIGLAICKKIVERHGGRIWVESTPGCGSTFYFTVPDIGQA